MKTACIFPGQGSQAVGMGVAVADAWPEARAVFDAANDIVSYDMYRLCADGPMEKLSDTRYTQPAMFTVKAAITAVLAANGRRFDAAAGHSLGEFGAWHAAGAIGFEDGLKLVATRGRLMSEADPEGRGAMAAVIGLDYDTVHGVCEETDGIVVVANINSPLQMVISGEQNAVTDAGAKLKDLGAKRVLPLKVSGAFHSPLMEEARAAFAEAVHVAVVNDAAIPVYANVTAGPVTVADEIRARMVEQLVSPVRWVETVAAMNGDGIVQALEIGPGAVLAGLVKRSDSAITVQSASDPDTIKGVIDGTT